MKDKIVHLFVLISLFFITINFSFIPNFYGSVYYINFMVILIVIYFFQPICELNLKYFLVFAAILLSIILNDIPKFFKPIDRFFTFTVIILLIGSFIKSKYLLNYRVRLFDYLNNIIVIMTILSFFTLILKINLNVEDRSDFNGVFTHSMVLGPMSAISALICLYNFTKSKKNILIFLYVIFILVSIVVCIAAASRAAIIGLIVSFLYLFTRYYKKKTKTGVLILIFFVLSLFSTYTYWNQYNKDLIGKFLFSSEQNDIASSRTYLWNNRIEEFESSPIIGIGFVSVNTGDTIGFDKESGNIQPGSSWLGVLSMTGVFGLLSLCLIFIDYVYRLSKKKMSFQNYLYTSLFLFFIIHMFFEGYIFSSGNAMFFYFWLLIGNLEIIVINSKPKIFKSNILFQ